MTEERQSPKKTLVKTKTPDLALIPFAWHSDSPILQPCDPFQSFAQGEWEELAEGEEEKGEEPNVPEAVTAVITPLGFHHWKSSQCV